MGVQKQRFVEILGEIQEDSVIKRYSRFFAVLSVVALALGLVVVSQVSAQLISGNLAGTVLDKTGAVVPGATVEAVNTQTGVKYETKANDAGEYRFNNLAVGTYNISASAANLATTTINGFTIELNMTKSLPITLEIKGAVTTVEVSGVAEALDTTTSTLATTFDPKMNADLPSTTLGPSGILNLSLLSSGVASSGGIGAGSGPSIGGQRPRNNNFTVEGIDNNSKSVTGPLVPRSVQFRVEGRHEHFPRPRVHLLAKPQLQRDGPSHEEQRLHAESAL